MEPARDAVWQEAWRAAGLATAQRIADREKFYAIVAYPGPSGFLHIGHFRGLVYGDALHRFHRMRGAQVFFPTGIHASGLPAVTFAQRVKERDPNMVRDLELNGVDPAEWPRLEDPETAARFLGQNYLTVFRSMGLLLDESAYLTTVDEDYRQFIRWQFHQLKHHGALVQKTHFAPACPTCGPVAVDPSETDLSSGGSAEITRYTTLPFRLEDGRTLLAATLRPETIYGITNVWIPEKEPLSVWHHEGRTYLVSRSGAERLAEQHGGRVGHVVHPGELAGKLVTTPLTGVRVPVLPSSLVDPHVGTGVVMSVPAHSPADALGLAALPKHTREALRAPPVILAVPPALELPASEHPLSVGPGTPAERANRATGAKSLSDTEALCEATDRLYRLEFVRGTMTVADFLGVPVREARATVVERLSAAGAGLELQEFSEPVICRNGHAVVIRRIPHQWFLRYSDPEWKQLARDALPAMRLSPEDYARDLPEILEWMDDRPATRRGRWLGTPFPFDPEWVIEPIADSTMYPAYFIVKRVVARHGLAATQLTIPFFDYVFLGEGEGEPSVDRAIHDDARAEFLYWYPLDLNIGGKEHKRVHFPPFVLTHVRLLAPELAPRGIFVHGWITTAAGEKLSKKDVRAKGGPIPPIQEALVRWGADALRLQYASAALPAFDLEWDPALADAAVDRLREIERLARATVGDSAGTPELEAWLASEMHQLVLRARDGFANAQPREAAEAIYVAVPTLLRRFYARGGAVGAATDRVGRAWIRMLSPITPHLAEELGAGRFEGLVATAPFPAPEEFARSERAEAAEHFLTVVEDDLRHVLRPVLDKGEKVPEAAIFYVAEPWKREVEHWMRESLDRGDPPTVPRMMERALTHPEVAAHRAEIPKYVQRVAPLLRSELPLSSVVIDEAGVLREAQAYLARRFGFAEVSVHREAEAASIDPMNRRDRARPGRPAFYLAPGRSPG
ncbi:MAG: class I tRNA ligase family protein [Thermoplasmata archaeon]